MSYIAVIGAGSWGTTLACLLAQKEYDVCLWCYEQELADEMIRTGTNSAYLPEAKLPPNLKVTADLEETLRGARYVLNVVPAQHTRSVFIRAVLHIPEQAIIISASKGIEHGTLQTVSTILRDICNRTVAVLSGPSFAQEVIRRLPTAVTLAVDHADTGLLLQEIFNTNYFRVYTHADVLGAELGGALKNVIAIASGITDGLCLGHNARASLITRGLVEIVRLGTALGADARTFSGLSGLGDLVLTCTGPMSRNYTVGTSLGKGLKLNNILSSTRSIAEGVPTALSAFQLARRHSVEMPIVEQVYKVLYEDKNPEEAVRALMNRALKSEY